MSGKRLRIGAAVFAALAAAGVVTAASAQAEPLWPGGPDIPGIPSIVPPLPAPVVYAPCDAAGVRMCMRLSTNEAWLIDNGRVTYGPTAISHGRPGYLTNVGVFDVDFKREDHWSTLHHVPMKWAVFFDGDIATHIGPIEEQSHGCIRMLPEGAEATFNHLNPGDVVQVVP